MSFCHLTIVSHPNYSNNCQQWVSTCHEWSVHLKQLPNTKQINEDSHLDDDPFESRSKGSEFGNTIFSGLSHSICWVLMLSVRLNLFDLEQWACSRVIRTDIKKVILEKESILFAHISQQSGFQIHCAWMGLRRSPNKLGRWRHLRLWVYEKRSFPVQLQKHRRFWTHGGNLRPVSQLQWSERRFRKCIQRVDQSHLQLRPPGSGNNPETRCQPLLLENIRVPEG